MSTIRTMSENGAAGRASRHRRALTVAFAALAVEVTALWLRGYRMGGRVIVRCRDGHLSTTLWIPGASVKSLRFGLWRLQRCPAGGRHWSIVTPVRRASLDENELRLAAQTRDLPIP
jgi:hypothetical protein